MLTKIEKQKVLFAKILNFELLIFSGNNIVILKFCLFSKGLSRHLDCDFDFVLFLFFVDVLKNYTILFKTRTGS